MKTGCSSCWPRQKRSRKRKFIRAASRDASPHLDQPIWGEVSIHTLTKAKHESEGCLAFFLLFPRLVLLIHPAWKNATPTNPFGERCEGACIATCPSAIRRNALMATALAWLRDGIHLCLGWRFNSVPSLPRSIALLHIAYTVRVSFA